MSNALKHPAPVHTNGRHSHRSDPLLYRASLFLKRRYPESSARAIRDVLQARYASKQIPHERTFQRWFRAAELIS